MADQDREQGGRGRSRQGGQRDGAGGFRIRLSDNELQAARTLQEAFQLRSTVAVLGFSLRTMADLLEQGALDEVISQQKRSGGGRPPRGERRGGDGQGQRDARPNPFARPSKPAAPEPEPEPAAEEPAAEEPAVTADVEATTEPAAASDEASTEAATEATSNEAEA
ncbi:hypothetical protein [Synechococcus sp. MIT S9452]|jgi:hypothetical protein|uniref:hypothetical protein n=1 Tax=Synechococcus sp. MIT S9452 TaxID=3082546 RepID=UPI0039A69F19|tara:strand:- start:1149 stop:1646 length:498 start_codon:yes stop_codon:yes gene_type:complete